MRREPARRSRTLTDLRLDPRVRLLAGGRVLLGGDPARLLRLRVPLDEVLRRRHQPTVDRLVDAGVLHPHPERAETTDVTVVVPVRDRADALDRCLTALGDATDVVVVDDGSHDAAAVAQAAARHGARLVRRDATAGPAAARTAGLAAASTPFVAFVDSDTAPPPGWLGALRGHLDDPRVAAVAPRVRSRAGRSTLARYASARSPLDLGPHAASVRPGSRVAYVPTAALLARRAAVEQVGGFDAGLRVGEDVDLVWRLVDAGWRVRYDPRTVVLHDDPDRWSAWLRRRHSYGASAAPLAYRHPDRLAPLVVPPWHTAACVLLAAGHPLPALAAAAVPAARLHRSLRRAGVTATDSTTTAVTTTGRALASTAAALGGAGAVVTAPVLAGLLAHRRTRRAAAVLLLVPPLLDALARRPRVHPVTWTALRLADDLAYASGVWRGCLSRRCTAPLRPRWGGTRSRPRD